MSGTSIWPFPQLKITKRNQINDGCLSTTIFCSFVVSFTSCPDYFINVNGGAKLSVLHNAEMSHTNFSKITWVIFVHQNTVVVLSSSVTSSTWMRAVLSDTAMTTH